MDTKALQFCRCHKGCEMKRVQLFGSSCGFAIAAMQFSTTVAFGQSDFIDEDKDDVIVVTATKRDESIQDVPMSITAIGSEQLQLSGAENYADYLLQAPGVAVISSGPGNQRITIRGISDSADTEASTQSTVGVYLDEVVISDDTPSSAPDLKMVDIERVEILRGPQGTLYGDSSVGGTVRVITKKPNLSEYQAEVSAGVSTTRYGDVNYNVSGVVNIPLVKDRLAFRGVGYHFDNSGFIDNPRTGVDNTNYEQTTGARLSVLGQITDSFSVTATALLQKQDVGARSNFAPVVGDLQLDKYHGELFQVDYQMYSLVADYAGPGFDIVSATAFTDFEGAIDNDFTDLINLLLGEPLLSFGVLRENTQNFSQEIRISSNNESRFNWLFGGYYFDSNAKSSEDDITIGIEDLFMLEGTPFDIGEDLIFASKTERGFKKKAIFGELGFEILDGLEASAGIRWFENEFTRDSIKSGFVFGLPFQAVQGAKEDKINLAFHLSYDVSDDILIYASATEGYRIGGLNNISPFLQNNPGFPETFQSDSLWNYELGWNTSWFDNRVTFNGAVFYIDWTDVQVDQVFNGFGFTANGGEASSRGAEFELSATLTEGLSVKLGGSIVDARFDLDVPILDALAGDALPGSVSNTFNASAVYEFPLHGEWDGYGAAYFAHVGEIASGSFVGATAGDYRTGNIRFGIRNDRVDISIFANNLWDERGITVTSTRVSEDLLISPIRPRTIGLNIRLAM